MPELPEVETVRRGLSQHVIGKKFKDVQALHPRATSPKSISPLRSLAGAKIKEVSRRGKFLWFVLDRPEVLVAHLGMSGQFLIQPKGHTDEKHLRARFDLGRNELRFIDQRTFGWLRVDQLIDGVPSCASHIAKDPFDPTFNIIESVAKFKAKKTQIKKAILDQEVLSGVGNIYADESLWRSKIHPEARTEKLKPSQIETLIANATSVMSQALEQGGTSFDDLYINVNGESGYFERSLAVYGREGEPCPRCGSQIRRIAFSNRSSHFCPKCQPRGKSQA
jgi:formamidopyrimidine-DNA glycosylase